jgi:hypothetical protein
MGHTWAAENGGSAIGNHAGWGPAVGAIEAGGAGGVPVVHGRLEFFAVDIEGVSKRGNGGTRRQHQLVKLLQALFVEARRRADVVIAWLAQRIERAAFGVGHEQGRNARKALRCGIVVRQQPVIGVLHVGLYSFMKRRPRPSTTIQLIGLARFAGLPGVQLRSRRMRMPSL